MNFSKDVMQLTPNSWNKNIDYYMKKYVLIDLEEGTEEYNRVQRDFRYEHACLGEKLKIQVLRVQHLYAYARYTWHKNNSICELEKITYTAIHESDLDTYLSTNCDCRVLSTFNPNVYIRIVRLVTSEFEERDSYYYAQYVIKVKRAYDIPEIYWNEIYFI